MFLRACASIGALRLAVLLLVSGCALPAARGGTIGLNFTGVTVVDGMQLNSNTGYAPPDNGGAVGDNHLVQLINGAYAVYDKSNGAQLQMIAAKQFWIHAGVNPGNDIVNLGSFNQRILYDPTVDRWIAAGLSGQSTNNLLMIARSDTSDPTGTWKSVSFVANDGQNGKFADFTNLGIDADGVYVSTNNFVSINAIFGPEYAMVFSLPKADLLAGTPTAANLSTFGSAESSLAGVQSIQPVIDYGPSKGRAPLVAISPRLPGNTPLDRLDLMNTSGPGATLSGPTPIDVSDYSQPPKAGQPDQTHSISTIDGRITSHVYQVGDTIYAVRAISQSGRAALSVMILDEPTNQLIEEIILADPDFDYFNASMAVNEAGEIVIGFTRSGTGAGGNLNAYAIVGRTVNGVTTFDEPLLLKESPVDNYHAFNNRWGDFTTTLVDPTDPSVFWTFQEFAVSSTVWGTQITQITVPEPASVALAAMGLAGFAALAWRRRRRILRRGV